MATPQEIARVLRWEIGTDAGKRYAQRIADRRGVDARDYADAARLLDQRTTEINPK